MLTYNVPPIFIIYAGPYYRALSIFELYACIGYENNHSPGKAFKEKLQLIWYLLAEKFYLANESAKSYFGVRFFVKPEIFTIQQLLSQSRTVSHYHLHGAFMVKKSCKRSYYEINILVNLIILKILLFCNSVANITGFTLLYSDRLNCFGSRLWNYFKSRTILLCLP